MSAETGRITAASKNSVSIAATIPLNCAPGQGEPERMMPRSGSNKTHIRNKPHAPTAKGMLTNSIHVAGLRERNLASPSRAAKPNYAGERNERRCSKPPPQMAIAPEQVLCSGPVSTQGYKSTKRVQRKTTCRERYGIQACRQLWDGIGRFSPRTRASLPRPSYAPIRFIVLGRFQGSSDPWRHHGIDIRMQGSTIAFGSSEFSPTSGITC